MLGRALPAPPEVKVAESRSAVAMPADAERGRAPLLFTLGIAALPVTYVLTVYLDQGVWINASLRAVVVTAILAVAIIAVSAFVVRDLRRGALIGACIFAMITIWQPALALLFFLLAAAIFADGLLAKRTGRRRPRDVEFIHGALGLFGLLVFAVTLVQFGLRGQTAWSLAPRVASAAPTADSPDIWLILVDGYPRADVLENDWGFDNEPFLNELESLGFVVAEGSRSNYNATKLTLPSMFNMALLREIEPYSRYDKPSDAPAADRVNALLDNRAFEILRQQGYDIVSVGGGYTHEELRSADEFIDAGTADVVELFLLGQSAFGRLQQAVMPDFGEGQIRTRIEANLASVERLSDEPTTKPRFVFVHIPGPHPPFVYSTIERSYASTDKIFEYPVDLFGEDVMREAYRQHIEHLNDLVLDSLTSLVDTVGQESIVIVMSDHGSRTYGHVHTLSPDDVAEQFSNLLVARTPDGTPLFDDEVMTTNVLSTVFDRYLGTEMHRAPGITESLDGTQYDPSGMVKPEPS